MSNPIVRDAALGREMGLTFIIAVLLIGIVLLLIAAYFVGYIAGVSDGAVKAFDYVKANFMCLLPMP